jgi:hypothetical protein
VARDGDLRVSLFQYGIIEGDGTWGSASVTCTCGREARRVYSPPMVYRTAKLVARALEREEKVRDEREVVTQVPLSSRRPPAASEHPRPAPQPGPQNRIVHTTTGGAYA